MRYHYAFLLHCLCSLLVVDASGFRLTPAQQCYYFGCSRAGGFVAPNDYMPENWNSFADFEKQPDGKMKLTIPYILRAQKPGRRKQNWDWINKARKYIGEALFMFEDTNVRFVEYSVFADMMSVRYFLYL